MKKFSYVSLMLALVISFILIPKTTNATIVTTPDVINLEITELNYSEEQIQPYDLAYLNERVKLESKRYCFGGVDARSINQEEVIIDTTNVSDIDVLSGSMWSSQIRTSESGSRIVSPTNPGNGYGYCHIFLGHMQWANGYSVETVNRSTQFPFAAFPLPTMDIIMDVVDGTTRLDPVTGKPNRKSKTAYSPTAGTRVYVLLEEGSSANSYGAYDWVVVTAYPK